MAQVTPHTALILQLREVYRELTASMEDLKAELDEGNTASVEALDRITNLLVIRAGQTRYYINHYDSDGGPDIG